MTTLPDWLSAARADAVAALHHVDEYGYDGSLWFSAFDFRERQQSYPAPTAAHIARFSPDVVLLVLGVLEAADAYRAFLSEQNPNDAVKLRYIIENFDRRVPIDALRAHVEGAGESEA